MSEYRYLKEEQYYIDLYDLHTIEECLHWYWTIKKGFSKERDQFKDYSEEKFNTEVHKITSYTVNVIAGERYRRKDTSINEWMERDRKTQDVFDSAIVPTDVECLECFSPTKFISKDLHDFYGDNSRVTFMLQCVKCTKRLVVYEDGTEWLYKPLQCPNCSTPLTHDSKHNKKTDVLLTIYSCPKCSYKKEDVYNFKKSRLEREAKEKRDKKLLEEYRKDFCWDDKTGQSYITSADGIKRLVEEWRQQEKKEKNPVYQKAKQLKQLKFNQLKELITKDIAKEGYIDLEFGKPDMSKNVIIDFTATDSKDDRKEYDSRNTLKKLINAALAETNWRLMSEGIHYRLGIVSGRLKAYEREEELMEIVS